MAMSRAVHAYKQRMYTCRKSFKCFKLYDAGDLLSPRNILKSSINTLGKWSFVVEMGDVTINCFTDSGLLL